MLLNNKSLDIPNCFFLFYPAFHFQKLEVFDRRTLQNDLTFAVIA